MHRPRVFYLRIKLGFLLWTSIFIKSTRANLMLKSIFYFPNSIVLFFFCAIIVYGGASPFIAIYELTVRCRDPNPPGGGSSFENANCSEIAGSFDVECAMGAAVTRARANDL